MRTLKFRVWSESDRCYRPDLNKLLTYGKSVVYSDEGDRFDIEQFTGLLDRNGKEIYEGDIIAQTLIDDPFTKKYPIYVVRWDEEFISWALKDVSGDDGNDTDLHFFIEEWKKCEVIGNIHESNMEELCQKGVKDNY